MIFFKLFKDEFHNDDSCVDALNKFLLEHPDLKVVSTQMMQYTQSKYGQILVQLKKRSLIQILKNAIS